MWLTYALTYGSLLSVVRPENPYAALTFSETEILLIACLMARYAHPEVALHLKACLRSGMTPEEVEGVQQAIEVCLRNMEAEVEATPRVPTPRVKDVIEEDDNRP